MPDDAQHATRERWESINCEKLSEMEGCFNGIVQHSFALQLPRGREFHMTSSWLPRRGRPTRSSASFSSRQGKFQQKAYAKLTRLLGDPTGAFAIKCPAQLLTEPDASPPDQSSSAGSYSWLVRRGFTRLNPQPLAILHEEPYGEMPAPLGWACLEQPTSRAGWDGLIFAQRGRQRWLGEEQPVPNDLLIEQDTDEPASDSQMAARILFQLWAHWRSRLFGVSLAHRFFNVFLPYAILRPGVHDDAMPARSSEVQAQQDCEDGAWLLQPFMSFVRDPDGPRFRRTCTFTALMVPVQLGTDASVVEERKLSLREVEAAVRGTWSLAAVRLGSNQRRFALDGPLRAYSRNVGYELPEEELSVRQWIEATLSPIVRLRRDQLQHWWRARRMPNDDELGDRVLSSLASSRVSTVTVVDDSLNKEQVRSWHAAGRPAGGEQLFPGSLPELIRAVSGRIYLAPVADYRVDQPFLDRDDYTQCVVPTARCLIATTTPDSQKGYDQSGLRVAVGVGYMALGAATAQALIRNSYHEIEARADPKEFGEISKECTRDFHEIYDLDIVWESYKRTYRAILEQFDIINDYEALRLKLDMLFNVTVAEFTEWQHTRLWLVSWLLVLLTIAVIVATVAHR